MASTKRSETTIRAVYLQFRQEKYPGEGPFPRRKMMEDWIEYFQSHPDYIQLTLTTDWERAYCTRTFRETSKHFKIQFYDTPVNLYADDITKMPKEFFNLVQYRKARLASVDWDAIRQNFEERRINFPQEHLDVDGEMTRLKRMVGE